MTEYILFEPPMMNEFQIFLVTEDNRLSEQTFQLEFELSTFNSTNFHPITTTAILKPSMMRVAFNFIISPGDNLMERMTFHLSSFNSSDHQYPTYLPPHKLYQETTIYVINAESK